MRIYAASSWKNHLQPVVVEELRRAGHEVYDFKDPEDNGGTGFQWDEVEDGTTMWKEWTVGRFIQALEHPISEAGFKSDFDAMKWADTCVLVLPSGRSAHIEAGWMQGAGKNVIIFMPGHGRVSDLGMDPELMYKMCEGGIVTSLKALIERLDALSGPAYINQSTS